MELLAILLAAGESRRMGRNKALLPFQGRTLLAYQVESLASLEPVSRIIVVLGFEGERLKPFLQDKPKVELVENPDYSSGRASSIKVGLAALSGEVRRGFAPSGFFLSPSPLKERGTKGERWSILIIGVDQPRPQRVLERLIEAHFAGGKPVTVPTYRGKRGHPVIFSAELLPDLLAISEEKQGLREVMARYRGQTLAVALDSPAVLLDINTEANYQEALGLFGG